MLTFKVSIVGDPNEPYPWITSQQHMWERPADSWPVVEVHVSKDDALGQVIDRAAAAVGLKEVHTDEGVSSVSDVIAYIAFRQWADGYQPPQLSALATLDKAGRVVWRRQWTSVRVHELLDAADHGLVEGDPEHLYLILPTAFGDFPGFDWEHVIACLWIVREVIGTLSDTSSAVDLFKLLRARLKKRTEGVEVVAARAVDWKSRGAAPSDLHRMLSRSSRSSSEVAALIGCTDQEAEAVLWFLGASYNDNDGKWYWNRTEEDRLFAYMSETAIWGDQAPDDLRVNYRKQVTFFIKNGRVPPRDDDM